jgi:hypothetical protein
MREALRRFAKAEYKRIAVQLANEKSAREESTPQATQQCMARAA